MLFVKQSSQVLCFVLCALSFGCDRNNNQQTTHIRNPKNSYTNSGVAGWIWQGTSNDVESETQIWQLSFPLVSPNWSSPSRFYPAPFPDQANWDIKTSGDFNGDGSADFLWRHRSTGAWRVWQMQRGLRAAQNNLPDYDAGHIWRVAGAGDTDRDGDDDVILNNSSTGEVIIWQMQNYAIVATHTVGTKGGYVVNRIGDFNKDGDVDLMLRQTGTDVLSVWEVEANALVRERKFPGTGRGWNPVCAIDADHDGDDDIMLVNNTDNQEKWFVMENYARQRQSVGATNIGYKFLGCGDYDGDGDGDSLWQNNVDGKNRVILQHNYGAKKQTIYINPFGGGDPANAGYGFEYRGNSN